jgi:hypothetical protein
MAEMAAIKAGKPKSTNPAGVESPSAPGSRDKLGERPLVAFDKADGLNKYEEVPTEKIGGKMGGGSKQTSRVPELPNPVSRDMRNVDPSTATTRPLSDPDTRPMGPFTKSVDLEEGSRSWAYQG